MSSEETVYKDFIGKYPIQKTLRFKLIPQGKTQYWVDKRKLISVDKERNDDITRFKEIADDFHREFIEVKLAKNFSFNWDNLAEAKKQCKNAKGNDVSETKKTLEAIQENLRKKIIEIFEYDDDKFDIPKKERNKDKTFVHIKKSEADKFLKTDLIPWMEKGRAYTEHDLNLIKNFNGFTTILRGFMENRANVYSDKAQTTSLANRIVNENFDRFYSNICILKELGCLFSDIKLEAKQNSKSHREIFALLNRVDFYNHCISPQGIVNYNEAIGEINKILNNYHQNKKVNKKYKLKILYKLQLCEGESSFKQGFIQYENDGELIAAIDVVYSEMVKDNKSNCFTNVISFIHDLPSAPKEKIFIAKKNLNNISKILYSKYSVLDDACTICCENKVGPVSGMKKKDAENWLKKDFFSFSELELAVESSNIEEDFSVEIFANYIESNLNELYSNILNNSKVITDLYNCEWLETNGKKLLSRKEYVSKLKDFLSVILDFYHFANYLYISPESNRDEALYEQLDDALAILEYIIPLHNRVRNYVTQKPYSLEKFNLFFDNPQFDVGDTNKEKQYRSMLFKGTNKFYLGIAVKNSCFDFDKLNSDSDSLLKKVEMGKLKVKQLLSCLMLIDGKTVRKTRDLPNLKEKYVPSEINRIKTLNSYSSGKNFNKDDCNKFIEYYMQRLIEYRGDKFDYCFKAPSEYEDYYDFVDSAQEQSYFINLKSIDEDYLNQSVDSGDFLLFQIYCKDFSDKSTGKKNLHTLYWEEIFNSVNFRGQFFRINSNAQIFYRPASIDKPAVHSEGEILVNKTYVDGQGNRLSLPNDVYKQIKNYKNGKLSYANLSEESRKYLDKYNIEFHEAKHEIIKDKRFTKDQYEFHIPITLNAASQGISKSDFNSSVLKLVKENPDVKILGIDRGERHLLYCTLIDVNGNILWQESFNILNNGKSKIDYHSKLDIKEKERDKARKSWSSIENIKDLKKGYLSQVVHKIATIAVKHSAIIVMEDLSIPFKRSRQKIDKSVYQAFEKQLIDKLSYVAVKPNDKVGIYDDGGIAKGYQLVPPFESFKNLRKQHGIVFYVSPWNTSHVDPTTGFMNLFRFKSSLSGTGCKEFFSKMDSIKFNNEENYFEFNFKYSKFNVKCEDYINEWTVCSYGDKRYCSKKNQAGKWETEELNITKRIVDLLNKNKPKIDFADGRELKGLIDSLNVENAKSLYWLFKQLVSLRYSKTGTTDDFILSPVKNKFGYFFNSDDVKYSNNVGDKAFPCDADANGAYHIALKGLQIRDMYINEDKNSGKYEINIENEHKNKNWVKYIQSRNS